MKQFITCLIILLLTIPQGQASLLFKKPGLKASLLGCSTPADADASNLAVDTNGSDYAAGGTSLEISDNASLSLGADTQFTVGGWVYYDNVSNNRDEALISKIQSNNGYGIGRYFNFGTDAQRMKLLVGNGSSTTTVQADTFGDLSNSTWYFVVGKYTGSQICISVNNGTFDCTSHTGTADDTAAFQINSNNGHTNQTTDGRTDEAFFIKEVLTSDNLTELYNGGTALKWNQVSCALRTKFDNNSGSGWWDVGEASGTRYDSTVNNNDLSPHNTPGTAAGNTMT